MSDKRYRSRPQRHGQDPCCARSRPGRLPEGPVRRVYDGRGPGQRDDRGARRAAAHPVPETNDRL